MHIFTGIQRVRARVRESVCVSERERENAAKREREKAAERERA